MLFFLPVRNHKLIIDIVFVFLRIFFILLVIRSFERLARFFLLPFVVGINFIIEPFLKNKIYVFPADI